MILNELVEVFTQTIMITFLVIMMMMLIEFLQIKTHGKWENTLEKKHWVQIIFAALLGLIPGCIGGFTVVSLFSHGLLGFGALLAALIASFGDEAFFLYSSLPDKAIMLSIILFGIAIFSGFIIDKIPFFAKQLPLNTNHLIIHTDSCVSHNHKLTGKDKHQVWIRYLLMGFILLFMVFIITKIFDHKHVEIFGNINSQAIQINHPDHFNTILSVFKALSIEDIMFISISLLALIMIIFVNNHFIVEHLWNHVIKKHFVKVFVWTFFILLFIQIGLQYIPLQQITSNSMGKLLILLCAILIGIIPQSGPHLLFVFLFIDGLIPFSILLANSIVQEGHSGLPLIAESRRFFTWIKIIKLILAAGIGIIGLWIGF